MNDKLQTAIACAGFIAGIYGIFVGGTLYSGAPMPDGELFLGVMALVGFIFGFKAKDILAAKK